MGIFDGLLNWDTAGSETIIAGDPIVEADIKT